MWAINRHLKAVWSNADNEASGVVEPLPDFWDTYGKKLKATHANEGKREQIVKNIRATVTRLFDPSVAVRETRCTYWHASMPHTLYFNPYLIDKTNLTSEQRASFLVMHASTYKGIFVIIDMSNVSWSCAMEMTRLASFDQIVDGTRLWTTLPHKILEIAIIKSPDPKFRFILHYILPRVLSQKLRDRLRVYDSIFDLQAQVNEGKMRVLPLNFAGRDIHDEHASVDIFA